VGLRDDLNEHGKLRTTGVDFQTVQDKNDVYFWITVIIQKPQETYKFHLCTGSLNVEASLQRPCLIRPSILQNWSDVELSSVIAVLQNVRCLRVAAYGFVQVDVE
jgi:hypothetical protein